MISFLPGIYLAALLNGAFLISLILRNKDNKDANILLSLLIGFMMISLWNSSLITLDVPSIFKFAILDVSFFVAAFFWAPLLFLYIRRVTNQHAPRWRDEKLHLAFPVALVFSQIFIKIWGYPPYFYMAAIPAFFLYVCLYIYLSFQCLQQHKHRIRETFSQVEQIELSWLTRLLWTFVAALAVDFVFSFAMTFFLVKYIPIMGMVVLLESGTIFAIGYFSLQQPQILFPAPQPNSTTRKKYDNSALDKPLSKDLADQLQDMMQKDQPYKRNDLKLGDLAELAGLSSHHLSQVINEQLGCNFYEYVNQYRIDYAAELMHSNPGANITRLAFDAGFNNRVSFTNAFKKKTGQTPSAYNKKQVLKAV